MEVQMADLTVYLLRFAIGGALVTLFASCGDTLKPRGFAGLFGAAPSIALAGLALAIHEHGVAYASTEARSMIIGATAFIVYALLCVYLTGVRLIRAAPAASGALVIWGLTAAAGGLLLGLVNR
jgi:hypothetical protein